LEGEGRVVFRYVATTERLAHNIAGINQRERSGSA